MSFGNEREFIDFLQAKEGIGVEGADVLGHKAVCLHPNTTIIDDKRYCSDCGKEVIREGDDD